MYPFSLVSAYLIRARYTKGAPKSPNKSSHRQAREARVLQLHFIVPVTRSQAEIQ